MHNNRPVHAALQQFSCFGKSGTEVIKKIMLILDEHGIFCLINVKMPTIVGILTFMSRKNSTIVLSERKKG